MNIDSRFIFENYKKSKKVIVESPPVYGDEANLGDPADVNKLPQRFLSGSPIPPAYEIGVQAQKQNKDIVDLTKQIIDKVKTDVFVKQSNVVDGQTFDLYFPGEPDEFRDKVKGVIVDVLGLDPGKSNANAGFAAREIIAGIFKVLQKKSSGGSVRSPKTVTTSSNLSNVANSPSVQQAVSTAASEAPTENTPAKNEVRFKLTDEYILKRDTPAKTDEKVMTTYHTLIDNVGAEIKKFGTEFCNALMKSGVPYSKAKTRLSELLAAGGLEKAENEEEGEVKALEPDSSDLEAAKQREIERLERDQMGGKTKALLNIEGYTSKYITEGVFSPHGPMQSLQAKLGAALRPTTAGRAESSGKSMAGQQANVAYSQFVKAAASAGFGPKQVTGYFLQDYAQKNLGLNTAQSPTLQALNLAAPVPDLPNTFMKVMQDKNAAYYTTPPPAPTPSPMPSTPSSGTPGTSRCKYTEDEIIRYLGKRGMTGVKASNFVKVLKKGGVRFKK